MNILYLLYEIFYNFISTVTTLDYTTSFLFLLFNLYFTICPAGHLLNLSILIAKYHVDGYPQRDTIFEFDYFISLVRSVECSLFGLLSMRVSLASAAS